MLLAIIVIFGNNTLRQLLYHFIDEENRAQKH